MFASFDRMTVGDFDPCTTLGQCQTVMHEGRIPWIPLRSVSTISVYCSGYQFVTWYLIINVVTVHKHTTEKDAWGYAIKMVDIMTP